MNDSMILIPLELSGGGQNESRELRQETDTSSTSPSQCWGQHFHMDIPAGTEHHPI